MMQPTTVPDHIAFIMDGNGRWAKSRGLSRLEGHRAGLEAARRIIRYLGESGIKYVTLYAFSTENWSRPEEEVKGLFRILADSIKKGALDDLHKNNVRIQHLGRQEGLPADVKKAILEATQLTHDNTGPVLSLALNYGGRQEIVDAVRRVIKDGIPAQDVTEQTFNNFLYTAGLPDVDLIVRTSGEMRLSNFLLWQSAYAEYYFTPVLWPDFDNHEMDKALNAYSQRQRRFGGL
jgi:undecaprenyl diphosphate synthase